MGTFPHLLAHADDIVLLLLPTIAPVVGLGTPRDICRSNSLAFQLETALRLHFAGLRLTGRRCR